MTKPRTVATPGADPVAQADATPAADAFQANGTVLGGENSGNDVDTANHQAKNEGKAAAVAATAGEPVPLAGDTAALQAQVSELAAMVQQLQAQQKRSTASMPSAEDHPTMAEVMKDPPSVPVLTKEGWYVPATTLATRA